MYGGTARMMQGNALVLARDMEHLLLDLVPDLIEVDKPLVEVEKLAPLVALAAGRVNQLEDDRSAHHDALAMRQEIAPNNGNSNGPFVRQP